MTNLVNIAKIKLGSPNNLYVSLSLKEAIDLEAKRLGISRGTVVKMAVTLYLREHNYSIE